MSLSLVHPTTDGPAMQLVGFQDLKESNCDDTKLLHLESAAKLVIEFGSPLQLQQLINDGDHDKFDQYLSAVGDIQQESKSGLITRYETHGTRAIKLLQLAFQEILNCSTDATNSDALSSTVYSSSVASSNAYELQGSNHTIHGELSSEQIYYLRSIVDKLNSIGCLGDCIYGYKISRRRDVRAKFDVLGWSIDQLQSFDCEEFSELIEKWIQTANKCYSIFFPRERKYYEQIFSGVRAVTYDNCFLPIVTVFAIQLNNFAHEVSFIASFQKLFSVLDLYKALFVILPEIQNIFSISGINIFHFATTTIKSLATVVRQLLSNFEDTVLNVSNTLPPEGTVHSLTEYAMDYLTSISQYKDLPTNIIVSRPTKSLGNQADELFFEALGETPLGLHVIWIIISLRINLVGKSCHYKDSSLHCVFMMNNVDYILKSITGSPQLQEMIRKEYLSILSNNVVQATQDYSSSIWHRGFLLFKR